MNVLAMQRQTGKVCAGNGEVKNLLNAGVLLKE